MVSEIVSDLVNNLSLTKVMIEMPMVGGSIVQLYSARTPC